MQHYFKAASQFHLYDKWLTKFESHDTCHNIPLWLKNGVSSHHYICHLLTLYLLVSSADNLNANSLDHVGLDKQKNSGYNCKYFHTLNFLHMFWVLKRTVSLSAHNICFS